MKWHELDHHQTYGDILPEKNKLRATKMEMNKLRNLFFVVLDNATSQEKILQLLLSAI
jgi:hypothetical protein